MSQKNEDGRRKAPRLKKLERLTALRAELSRLLEGEGSCYPLVLLSARASRSTCSCVNAKTT